MTRISPSPDIILNGASLIAEPSGALYWPARETLVVADLPGAPAGDYRMISFDTAYSASPERVETVVMHKENGRWSVVGYFIR